MTEPASVLRGESTQKSDGVQVASGKWKPLHVAITSPFIWPWVRRGSERLLHDLSRYLIARGHRVTVFATGPHDLVEDRGGIPYHVLKQRWPLWPRQFNCCHDFAFRLQAPLSRCDADVVFSMSYFDAYAAIRARARTAGHCPVVFHSAGVLSRRYFRAVPLDAWLFRTVRSEADAIVAVSRLAGDTFERDFGRDAEVLPPPVMAENFAPTAANAVPQDPPGQRILFVGDADERRKGARALCRAFARVSERHPQARLLFAGRASAATKSSLLDVCVRAGNADRVAFLGVGRVEDLPAHYRAAAVTVLPAVGESFGMALAESLSAGTPVVGARHAGLTEIIDKELVGRLFDPGEGVDETNNIDGLAGAILEVLARGKTPEVVAACLARAQRYSWAVLGPEYERVLQGAVAASDDARRGA